MFCIFCFSIAAQLLQSCCLSPPRLYQKFVGFDFSAKRILSLETTNGYTYDLSDEAIGEAIRYDSVVLYISHDVLHSMNSNYKLPFTGALYACSEREINKNHIDEIILTSETTYAGVAAGDPLNGLVKMTSYPGGRVGSSLNTFDGSMYGGEFLIIFDVAPSKEDQFTFHLTYHMTDGSEIRKSIENLRIKP